MPPPQTPCPAPLSAAVQPPAAVEPPATASLLHDSAALQVTLDYHQRTKHLQNKFAPGPGTLDWDAQPAPFRNYAQAPRLSLARLSDASEATRQRLQLPFPSFSPLAPEPLSLANLGVFFQLCLGVSAYKSLGPDCWAVRANPSSGNLHPVEGYLLSFGHSELSDGLFHYCAQNHALEQIAQSNDPSPAPGLYLALSTLAWRESWKYGERAFRYCQLDVGHALAAVDVAARCLGWRTQPEPVPWLALQQTLGFSRPERAAVRKEWTEHEEAELLVALTCAPQPSPSFRVWPLDLQHCGEPNVIDAHPMYRWPAVENVQKATRDQAPEPPGHNRNAAESSPLMSGEPVATRSLQEVVLGRRSAQRFTSQYTLSAAAFQRMLRALCAPAQLGITTGASSAPIDILLYVHRVEGFNPGLYLLARSQGRSDSSPDSNEDPGAHSALLAELNCKFDTQELSVPFAEPRLHRIAQVESRLLARQTRLLHCHQDIASTCAFALGMLCDLEAALAGRASNYRELLREAGKLGHALYLAAEREGVSGTGIGCFLDDAVAEMLSLSAARSLYHFSVGQAVSDPRITHTPV